MILAGGKGTRLGFTEIPKPMVIIDGIPLLERQIRLAESYGIKDIFLLTGYKYEVIFNHFGNGNSFGVKITYLQEPFPLGTAGSLKLAEYLLDRDERFLVFYGDLALDIDIQRFIDFDQNNSNSLGTLMVHPNNHPLDSDLVETDEYGKVIGFLTKPHSPDILFQNLANAAVYILSPRIFDFIPYQKSCDLAGYVFPELLRKGESLYAYNTPEYLKDMGTPGRLEKVNQDFRERKPKKWNLSSKRRAIFLDRDGVLNENLDPPNPEHYAILPKVSEAIEKINRAGFLAILVTNQPAIAKGMITKLDLQITHKKLETYLGRDGAYLDAIYFCPHHPEKGFEGEIPELKISCKCRKPEPGMLLEAGKKFSIDFENSWLIGDSERDLIAGKKVGCKTILIGTGASSNADYHANHLLEAVDLIFSSGN